MKNINLIFKTVFYLITVSVALNQIAFSQKSENNIHIKLIRETEDDSVFKNNYQMQKRKNVEFHPKDYINVNNNNKKFEHIISDFNSDVLSPDGKYNIAYYEGGACSRYIGVFNSNKQLVGYHEVLLTVIVNFSSNSDYFIVQGSMKRIVYCFNRHGDLIAKVDLKKYLDFKERNFHRAFVDNEGKYIMVGSSYRLNMYDIKTDTFLWEDKLEARRLFECVFNNDKGLVFTKTMMPVKDWMIGDSKYSLNIHTISDGKRVKRIKNIAEMYVKENRFLIKSKNKWYEYAIF